MEKRNKSLKEWWVNRIIYNVLRENGEYLPEEKIDIIANLIIKHSDKKRTLEGLYNNDLDILDNIGKIIGRSRIDGKLVSLYLEPDGKIYGVKKENEYIPPEERIKILR
jgi:DNA modification methylase